MELPAFFNEGYLKEKEGTDFVKRLRNTAAQLALQIEYGCEPGGRSEYAFGVTDDDLWDGIKFQFQEAVREAAKLARQDKVLAQKALEQFRQHFQVHIKHLE